MTQSLEQQATQPRGAPVAAANDNRTGPIAVGVQPAAPSAADSQPTVTYHTTTQSTLAPTSEYMRYLLAAWGARYVFRGFFGTLFDKPIKKPFYALAEEPELAHGAWSARPGFTGEPLAVPPPRTQLSFREKVLNAMEAPGNWIQRKFPHSSRDDKVGMAYNASLAISSTALTFSYTKMVYEDIMSLFREEVAEETGKTPDKVTFGDIRHSNNRIIQQTMRNFWQKLGSRLAIDALFFPAAWLGSKEVGDFVLGGKALQLFLDTWKRKPTMFEDLVTFVNNKINPRNGLGQPIAIGEVFDLYQHYAEAYHPERMFRSVLSRHTSEGERRAISQPIFTRLTELMNNTYSFKHGDLGGDSVAQADFALPKLIYMLGHDLIDPTRPAETLALIEVMNARGAVGIKQAQAMLQQGATAEAVMAQFQLAFPHTKPSVPANPAPEGLVHKGSTMQLDAVPQTRIASGKLTSTPLTERAAALVQS